MVSNFNLHLYTEVDVKSPQIDNVTLGCCAICANPKVTVDETTLECDAPPALATDYGGTFALTDLAGDGKMMITVYVGGQSTGTSGADKFEYKQPKVTGIFPAIAKMEDVVVVQGDDLGAVGDAVSVEINGRPSKQRTFITAQLSFRFVVPVGTSTKNAVVIKVNGRAVSFEGVDPLFDYKIPELNPTETVPPSTTRGGAVATFGGTGFGPVGNKYINSVVIDGVGPCIEANVTVEDVKLECTTGRGRGTGINTTITIDGQASLLTPAFSFHVPVVESVAITGGTAESYVVAGESIVYITGQNFGDGEEIVVKVKGDNDLPGKGVVCPLTVGDGFSYLAHPREIVRCIAPLSVGKDVSVIINVAGLENVNADMNNKISYAPPTITSAFKASLFGWDAYITGTNFGPVGRDVYLPQCPVPAHGRQRFFVHLTRGDLRRLDQVSDARDAGRRRRGHHQRGHRLRRHAHGGQPGVRPCKFVHVRAPRHHGCDGAVALRRADHHHGAQLRPCGSEHPRAADV